VPTLRRRWVWLNRGDGSSQTNMRIVKVKRFLDELRAVAGKK
jgi:hypothetical protein